MHFVTYVMKSYILMILTMIQKDYLHKRGHGMCLTVIVGKNEFN